MSNVGTKITEPALLGLHFGQRRSRAAHSMTLNQMCPRAFSTRGKRNGVDWPVNNLPRRQSPVGAQLANRSSHALSVEVCGRGIQCRIACPKPRGDRTVNTRAIIIKAPKSGLESFQRGPFFSSFATLIIKVYRAVRITMVTKKTTAELQRQNRPKSLFKSLFFPVTMHLWTAL